MNQQHRAPPAPAQPVTMAAPSLPHRDGTTARERRRQAKLSARLTRWWSAIPAAERRAYYTAEHIEAGTGTPIHVLGPTLRAAGWDRVRLTVRGTTLPVWIAPGARRPSIPVGREADAPRNSKGQYL